MPRVPPPSSCCRAGREGAQHAGEPCVGRSSKAAAVAPCSSGREPASGASSVGGIGSEATRASGRRSTGGRADIILSAKASGPLLPARHGPLPLLTTPPQGSKYNAIYFQEGLLCQCFAIEAAFRCSARRSYPAPVRLDHGHAHHACTHCLKAASRRTLPLLRAEALSSQAGSSAGALAKQCAKRCQARFRRSLESWS